MSQSTRLFGAQFSGVSIGGTSFAAVAETVDVEWTLDTGEARALKDTSKYPIGIIDGWSMTGTFFISTAATSGEGGPGGSLWTKALLRTQVAVSCVDNAVSGAGNTLSGNGVITSCKQTIGGGPTEPQKIAVTITGQGVLGSAIA